MGITGLLPFLDKSSRRANIKEFSGETVAIDAYCWLHKGAFSCADKLIMNEPTSVYINYCMKFINMLLSHNIKPILVFDGRYLPAKAEIEKKRRENRSLNLKKGAELLKAGQVDQGRSFLRRSVDITHKMALNLIKQCRGKNVDYIVAPYEADAQLAYLNIMNIAQLVITEDSDLLLFGCIKVLFKMDINGNGILIEKDKLHLSMGVRHDSFSIDKFRYMCILSGCDYLPSLPGIGLHKARKFINRTSEENMYEALLKLPVNLQMWALAVTDEYRSAFIEADRTFRYQLVYDPIKRRQVPLSGTEDDGQFVGEKLQEDVAFQLAIGNIDPMTMEKLDDYNPDKQKTLLSNNKKNLAQSHSSIWSNNFVPRVVKRGSTTFPVHNATKGLTIITGVSLPPVKRPTENDFGSDQLTGEFLKNLYGNSGKSQCEEVGMVKNSSLDTFSPKKSPILLRRKNPFALESPLSNSVKRKRLLVENIEKTLDTENLLRSRYFKQEEDISHGVSSNVSVLDIIGKQENCLNVSKWDESQKESGNLEGNNSDTLTSFSKSYSKVKESCTDIQIVISEASCISKESKRDSIVGGTENDETPKENSCILSDNESCVNGPPNIVEAPSGGDNGIKQKLVLSPVNDNSQTNKKFYYSCKSEDSDKGHTSPYFQEFDSVNNSVKVLDSESAKSLTKVSLIRSTQKSVLRSGFSKSNKKKTQSLLTRFGFQPRPKVQSEKT